MKFVISTFSSNKDNRPARGELTWEQIVASLASVRSAPCALATCERSDCEHKIGLAWSPGCWAPGHKRKVFNVEAVSLVVVDLDHVAPSDLPAMLARVAPFRHVLHASHSDRPDDRCLRVVLVPSRPVPGPDWPRFWTATMRYLGVPADPRCKDGSRLYYTPSRPADACHLAPDGTGFSFGWQDGALLDVDALLASAPLVEEVEFDDFEVPDYEAVPEEKFLAAVQRLAAAWPAPGQNRHEAHLALAGALARAGWPAEVIAEFAYGVAHTQIPGSGDRRKRLSAARSSVEKAQTGARVKGWPALEAVLSAAGSDGASAVRDVTELLGIEFALVLDEAAAAAMGEVCRMIAEQTRKLFEAEANARQSARKVVNDTVNDAASAIARAVIGRAVRDVLATVRIPGLEPFLVRAVDAEARA